MLAYENVVIAFECAMTHPNISSYHLKHNPSKFQLYVTMYIFVVRGGCGMVSGIFISFSQPRFRVIIFLDSTDLAYEESSSNLN